MLRRYPFPWQGNECELLVSKMSSFYRRVSGEDSS